MQTLTLETQPRATGKAAAGALRRAKEVPAVLYGPHTAPVHFAVPALAMRPLIHTSEAYRVALKVDGATHDCILKRVDYHPVTDAPIHADFYALTRGEKLTLTVPVVLVGTAPGIREGGDIMQPLHEVEVRCLPKDIPGHIEVDVSALGIGDAVHLGDLRVENVEILGDPAQPIVLIAGKKASDLAEAAAEDAAAAAAAAED